MNKFISIVAIALMLSAGSAYAGTLWLPDGTFITCKGSTCTLPDGEYEFDGGGAGGGGGDGGLGGLGGDGGDGGLGGLGGSSDQDQWQGQIGINGQSQDSNSLNSGTIDLSDRSTKTYIEEAQDRNPVSSAFAAPLVATEDTCMGSSSAAGQGITFGLSLATTWSDADCVIRKDARLFHNVGQDNIALSLMCEKESVRAAVARAGDAAQLALCDIAAEDAETVGDLDGNTGASNDRSADPFADAEF